MNKDDFDRFLSWLNQNREEAGNKYEDVRRKLIKIFTCQRCANAEELADVTITRVIKKVPEIADSYKGDPMLYFCGVARNVYLEQFKHRLIPAQMPMPDPPEEKERRHNCLDECMSRLTPAERRMVLEYYHEDKAKKIELRKKMAERLGIKPNALRIKMHRIRAGLRECLVDCLEKSATL